jgi:hypothetical protein
MEQVEGGDLIVNRGEESKPKGSTSSDAVRDLNTVDGYEAAVRLAQANLDDLIKNHLLSSLPSCSTFYEFVYSSDAR